MLRRSLFLGPHVRAFSQAARLQKWTGSDPSEHVTNSNDNLDVHTQASKAGAEDRNADGSGLAQSTTERDHRNSQKKVKEEFPEAPKGPVIGMNDERGSKGI